MIIIGCNTHSTATGNTTLFIATTIGIGATFTITTCIVAEYWTSAGFENVTTHWYKLGAVFGMRLNFDGAFLAIVAREVLTRIFALASFATLGVVSASYTVWAVQLTAFFVVLLTVVLGWFLDIDHVVVDIWKMLTQINISS